MKSIFDRTSFYTQTVIDYVSEYDLGSVPEWDYDVNYGYIAIKETEEGRPDLLSYRVYQDDKYWWMLCSYNNIMDIQHQFMPGTILKVPSIEYFRSFAKDYSH